MAQVKKQLALAVASTILSLVLAEILLRGLTDFPDKGSIKAMTKSHPALGYVMRPDIEGIDESGFRNPEVSKDVDLVACGDSHTYGYNVERRHSWPALLAAQKNLSAYVYANGGYGILHYRWLFDDATTKNPKYFIVGLYLANDLADYCRYARRDYWKPQLEERGVTETQCPERRRGPTRHPRPISERIAAAWLGTALGSAIDYIVWQPLAGWLPRKGLVTFKYGHHRTVLEESSIRRHKRVMDLDRPEVAEAYRVMLILFSEMADIARARGISLGVLFIPSKENALFDGLDASDPYYEVVEDTVRTERALMERTQLLFRGLGIASSDPLACFRAASQEQLYSSRLDSHPLAAGYRCYAEAAAQLFDGWSARGSRLSTDTNVVPDD